MKSDPIKPGDVVWFQSSVRHYPSAPVIVTKVGRKWVTLSNGCRFTPADGFVDGGQGTAPGRVYANRAAYEAELVLDQQWRDVWTLFNAQHRRPPHIDAALCRLLTAIIKGDAPAIAQAPALLAPRHPAPGADGGRQ